MAIKRRKFIRVVSYLVAVSVVFAASGMFFMRAKAGYEETLGKVRLSNLTSLCEYSREVGSGLRVLAVSSGDSTADSMAFVRDRIMGAVGCINTFDAKNTKHMSKFFGKVYTFAENFTGTDKERETAIKLSIYAQEIYYHLNDVSSAVLNGAYSLAEYASAYKKSDKPYFEQYLDYSNGKEKELFKLVSPASAQVGGYMLLDGKRKISETDARQIASGVIGINPTLWRKRESYYAEELYSLKYGDVSVEICEKGGALFRMVNPMPSAEAFYSADEAKATARQFLRTHGFDGMTCMKKKSDDFNAEFEFVPSVNGVLLLNAGVRISVCLSNGEVTFLDASEYLKNYRTDVFFKEGSIDASGVLPAMLEINETSQCIADINGKTKRCLLAVSSFDGAEVWSYIDFESGRVLKTEII